MKILGINGNVTNDCHDCAACLIIDGKIIGNYEEERFDRIKHTKKFPILSIKKLLFENNLKLEDIDYISVLCADDQYEEILNLIDSNRKSDPVHIKCDHHIAHICDAYYHSGFKSSAVVVVDGYDSNTNQSITIALCKENEIKILKQYGLPQSLGMMYELATQLCDLGHKAQGKFMGLSSYGKDDKVRLLSFNNETKDIDCLYHLIPLDTFGDYTDIYDILSVFVKKYYYKNYYPYKSRDAENILYYINFARTIQENFNEVYFDIIKYAKELTHEDNLCLSGGCIQNCIGNNIIAESGLFKNIFSSPAPHDAGAAAGMALYASNVLNDNVENKRLTNSYVGFVYSDEDILKELNEDVIIEEYNVDKVLNLLKNNKIIAWFQGGSEIGPRALGHRSILANPSNRNNLNIINDEIKNRENWRPLAPTIPSELFDMVFDVKNHDLTEFMLRTIPIKKEWQNKMLAVCHIDETTRPQYLERDINPELYDLIMNFYNKTGIPALINTSFNDRGQPIIETPKQAIEFLFNTPKLDYIIFNAKYIVSRK